MKKILFSISILLFAVPQLLFSQGGWIKYFTGPGNVLPRHIVKTSDGNYVFTVSTNEGLAGNMEAGNYLIKIDANANVIWTNKFSEFGTYSRTLEETWDNGFILTTKKEDPNGAFLPYWQKLDANGDEEWGDFIPLGNINNGTSFISKIIKTSDNGYLLIGRYAPSGIGSNQIHIRKYDSNFNETWGTVKDVTGGSPSDVVELPQGGYTIGCSYALVFSIDENGNELWETSVPNIPIADGNFNLFLLPDGGYMLSSIYAYSYDKQIKLDSNGGFLWEKPINPQGNGVYTDVIKVDDGFIYGGSCNSPIFGPSNTVTHYTKIDFEGDVVWEKFLDLYLQPGTGLEISRGIESSPDNGAVLICSGGGDTYVLRCDSLGNIFPQQIIGQVARDEQLNCQIDSGNVKITSWIISAENSNQNFYTNIDTFGNYTLPIDTGEYVLTIHPPNNLWTACENEIDITVESNETIEQDFPMETMLDCPILTVSSAFPSARPCFENRQSISYCNQGTNIAEDAYIEIDVDSNLTYVSSSISLTSQVGNTLTFDLGDVLIGECGNFYIDYFLDCNTTIGESICIESHAYPDSTCLPDPNWNGAFVEVDAYCQDSTITFYLENIGSMDMPTSNTYIVVEDAILLISEEFQLQAGEQDSVSVSTNGSTFIMAAEQVEDAPGSPFPTTWVEGCTTNGSSNFSVGFVNQFPLGDDAPYLDIDCTTASNSYDPNDKQGYPLGYDDEHYIRPNTDLEYLIRFQNTGTDTAFTVVIRDTIAPELDIPSIQVGPASHDYSWRIYGENILEFTFNVIMLPDSNVNEPASHGFVEFKISQKEDLPLGTIIKNKAAIYFDYNDPIITNETFHTLGENFITVSLQRPIEEDYSLLVRPNPLQEFAIFEMKKEIKNGLFELYDVTGKLAYQQKFNGSEFELKRNNLNTGIYFYKISENGKAINSGKIVVN